MAVKRPKKGKLSKRIPAALTKWLKRQNPGAMQGVTHVRVKKLKGGGVSIIPNPAKQYQIVQKLHGRWVHGSFETANNPRQAVKQAKASGWYSGIPIKAKLNK